jgi:hypothetical protein
MFIILVLMIPPTILFVLYSQGDIFTQICAKIKHKCIVNKELVFGLERPVFPALHRWKGFLSCCFYPIMEFLYSDITPTAYLCTIQMDPQEAPATFHAICTPSRDTFRTNKKKNESK